MEKEVTAEMARDERVQDETLRLTGVNEPSREHEDHSNEQPLDWSAQEENPADEDDTNGQDSSSE
jgi:hypothetical protein